MRLCQRHEFSHLAVLERFVGRLELVEETASNCRGIRVADQFSSRGVIVTETDGFSDAVLCYGAQPGGEFE